MLLRLNFWMLLLQGVDERRCCCCCSLLLGWCCCCVGLLLMLRVATIAVGTKDTVLDSNLSLTNWNRGQGGEGGAQRYLSSVSGEGGSSAGHHGASAIKLLDWLKSCAYLCSARLFTYTLHVCIVCQHAGRMSDAAPSSFVQL